MCVQLYSEVRKLLSSYEDLMTEFAAFLEPGQAVDCNCLMDNLLYTRADRCILALQVHSMSIVECSVKSFIRLTSRQYLVIYLQTFYHKTSNTSQVSNRSRVSNKSRVFNTSRGHYLMTLLVTS